MTPHELVAILDKHERWLAKKPGGIRANLAMIDLQGMHLAGSTLESCKLSGAGMSRPMLQMGGRC
jgi:hypothetical protein